MGWAHEGLEDFESATNKQRSLLRAIWRGLARQKKERVFRSALLPEEVFLFEAEGFDEFLEGLTRFQTTAILGRLTGPDGHLTVFPRRNS